MYLWTAGAAEAAAPQPTTESSPILSSVENPTATYPAFPPGFPVKANSYPSPAAAQVTIMSQVVGSEEPESKSSTHPGGNPKQPLFSPQPP